MPKAPPPHPQQKSNRLLNEYLSIIIPMLQYDDASTSGIRTGVDAIRKLSNDIKDVKTHQVRNIYKLIKDSSSVKKLNLIRPKLAYIAARQKNDEGKDFIEVIDKLIVRVTEESDNTRQLRLVSGLKYIMESIVAFHKFYAKE